MSKYGGAPVKHIRELAFMGFVKVILNLRTILGNISYCKRDIEEYKPDVIILIDYAGINLKISEFAKSKGINVYYYIYPKIWAWKTNRVKKIKKNVDEMFTILPFETDFYNKYDYKVNYVGNPVNDAIVAHKSNEVSFDVFTDSNNLEKKPVIALLAGSRKQEIKLMLPVMIEVSHFFPNYQFVIAGAPSIDTEFYYKYIGNHNVPIVYGQTYNLLLNSKAALVTSGTATLETAILNIPQIVCYKTSVGTLLYKIGRMLLKVKWISLVNLILNREAVKEITQNRFKKEFLIKELDLILNNQDYRQKMLESYALLRNIIGEAGASKIAAKGMLKALNK
jgi:lipid-A-disaccharide synthase